MRKRSLRALLVVAALVLLVGWSASAAMSDDVDDGRSAGATSKDDDDKRHRRDGLGRLLYLYGVVRPIPPGEEVEFSITCPAGTVAVSGGWSQFDTATDLGNPDVVPTFSSIVSSQPPPNFDARRYTVFLHNSGTSTTTVANARAVCGTATEVELVRGVES